MVSRAARSTPTLQGTWIGATLAYGALRVALAGAFLADYGVNIIVFAVIELSSSYVFGRASGRLVDALIHERRGSRLRLALITLAGYAAPDVYVILHVHRFPDNLRNTVLGIVAGTTIISVAFFAGRIRAERLENESEVESGVESRPIR